MTPHHLVRGPATWVPLKTFMAAALGLSGGMSLPALKGHLHEAALVASPEEKLELVMVENIDHFAALLAAEGVPLARDEVPAAPARSGAVTLPRWQHRVMLGLTFVATPDMVYDIVRSLVS